MTNIHTDIEPKSTFDLSTLRAGLWQQLINDIDNKVSTIEIIERISAVESYWAFPGVEVIEKLNSYLQEGRKQQAKQLANNLMVQLGKPRQKVFEPFISVLDKLDHPIFEPCNNAQAKPCFELLIYHPNPQAYARRYHQALSALQTERDEFYYELVFVDNLADAICAIMSNDNIQACLSVSNYHLESQNSFANDCLAIFPKAIERAKNAVEDNALTLQHLAKKLRPELEHYYLSEVIFNDLPPVYFERFNRVFYQEYPFKDLHFNLLNGLRERYNAPFYNALHAYSRKPKGVFHALPISRGSSVKNSVWLNDFYQFYGENVFLAETSSTQGGMDSLLNPKGAIKNSQNKAALCFGAQQSYFVTNGTSTSNKIVMQANVQPGDIIFVSSDCHKSVPYGVMLAGAHAVFLQTNAVEEQDLYGAVSLSLIKERLFALKAVGLLDKVKKIILTNSTFDGLIYDVEQYMQEILAIKPDMIFHWDEAWFAHAHFNCLYQKRHAMSVAAKLRERFNSSEYHQFYLALSEEDKAKWPDPNKVVLRVYATQSTHKTLSSFRQGSMIHIYDEAFIQEQFLEAFYTHTSTSPNYQILASLDIARRQMNIEGFALSQKSIRLSHFIRQAIQTDNSISQVFSVLSVNDIYPEAGGEKSAVATASEPQGTATSAPIQATSLSYLTMLSEFNTTGFVIDPTRITVDVRKTGMNGNAFRQLLIDKYDIQVNKTSEFTVLFIVNIGASEETANYLLSVLREITEHILTAPHRNSSHQNVTHEQENTRPAMPQLRQYHPVFSPQFSHVLPKHNKSDTDYLIDMRKAYYASYNTENTDYILLSRDVIVAAEQGKTWVSAVYVTPYPPGFPMLVPGQIIDIKILRYFSSLTIKEIHGYHIELGLKVFGENYLNESSVNNHHPILPNTSNEAMS